MSKSYPHNIQTCGNSGYFSKKSVSSRLAQCQKGLSLIELMIAMLIGLFLMLSISSVYINNLKTNTARDQFSILEDNARLALDSMTRIIEHTGYNTIKSVALAEKFITGAVNADACVADQTTLRTTVDGANGDSIGVVFIGDDEINTDCAGNVMPANCRLSPSRPASSSRIFSSFFLENTGELKCVGSNVDGNERVLAEGIDNLQISYGVDANGDGTANRYINATQLAASGLWNNVVSVQLAVLARSLQPVKDKSEALTYTLLDVPFTSPNDRFQRAVFSTTVYLRNTL